jgi:hypothetical protein
MICCPAGVLWLLSAVAGTVLMTLLRAPSNVADTIYHLHVATYVAKDAIGFACLDAPAGPALIDCRRLLQLPASATARHTTIMADGC